MGERLVIPLDLPAWKALEAKATNKVGRDAFNAYSRTFAPQAIQVIEALWKALQEAETVLMGGIVAGDIAELMRIKQQARAALALVRR